ncbi:hypothetical protein ACJZ2D_016802 [Fusarium nematophilum]
MATLARFWHMDPPDKRFKELLKNKAYFKKLFNMLKSGQDHEGFFITDIVSLVDAAKESRKSHGTGVEVQALVDPSSGIQAGAMGQNQVMSEKGYLGYSEGETIVFLGYRRARLEKTNSIMAKLGRISLGRACFTVRDGLDYWPQTIEKPDNGTWRHCRVIRAAGRNWGGAAGVTTR